MTVLIGSDFLLNDRLIMTMLLTAIAIGIAFGPEIRHSFARIRGSEPPLRADSTPADSPG